MIYVITTNDLSKSGYYVDNDNFQVSLLEEMVKPPKMSVNLKITTFYNQADDVEGFIEEYNEDESDDVYEFIQIPYLFNSIETIIGKIKKFYNDNIDGKLDEDKDDLMVVTVIPGKLGRTIVKDMNTMLRKAKIEVEVMSLYQLFGVSESSEMSKIIKNKLGTEFVYDEDPIFFSYAIYQTLGIGRAD